MLSINVSKLEHVAKGHVLATSNVTLTSEDGIDIQTILGTRVLQNRCGELWVAFPTQNTRDFEGVQKFSPILDFTLDLKRRITDSVLAEYAKSVREATERASGLLPHPTPAPTLDVEALTKELLELKQRCEKKWDEMPADVRIGLNILEAGLQEKIQKLLTSRIGESDAR